MSLKGETRMFVHNKEMEKMTVLIVMAVILFSSCMVLFSDSSLAEDDEATIEQIDPVKITVDGEEKTVDAFSYLGVIYAVTSDRESEEEVGVYGVDDKYTGSVYIVVCAFGYGEEDDAISYTVTNVLSEFANSTVSKPLVMADTVLDFGKDCFKNITSGTIYVSNDVDDEVIANVGYPDVKKIEEVTTSVTFSFEKGAVTYPQDKYKNQTMDDQEIFQGITTQISECSFENPYYDFDGWLKGEDVVAGDCASITYYDGNIYVDGREYMAADNMTFTATWVESDYDEDHKNFGDYPLTYMYITSAIVIILFIVGFAMLGYRMYTARKA